MTIILPGAQIPSNVGGRQVIDLLRDFCDELALPQIISIADIQDDQARQIVQIANRMGDWLCREFDWQVLVNQHSFTTETGKLEYDLPADWMRSVHSTAWDSAKRLPMYGAMSPQTWAAYKALSIGAGVELFYRVINGRMVLIAEPPENDQVQFEYISKYWVVSSAGGYFDRITRDDDVLLFDDSLMLEGMLLRWRKTKGLPFEENDFARILMRCKGQDVPGRVINTGCVPGPRLINASNIPDSGYGGA